MADDATCVATPARSTVFCGGEVFRRLGGVPMCRLHYGRALNAAIKILQAESDADYSPRRWDPDAAEVVYYVRRVSDGLIKIGTSAGFRGRLSGLRGEHGELQVLLTHRGDLDVEYAMHRKFAALRVHGEFFRPRRPLIAWIVTVRGRQNPATVLPGTLPVADIEALAPKRNYSRRVTK